ncbi:MAG: pilus assembly protein CpaF [Methylophagaceae bacterium]|jgi:pilus assembly protein CpaF
MFEIKVLDKKGREIEAVRCGADSCEIGSSRDGIIRIRGWRVSPRHARFTRELAGVFIEDVSNGAGISVNDKTVDRHGPITEIDNIVIGGHIVEVKIIDDVVVTPASDLDSPPKAMLNDEELLEATNRVKKEKMDLRSQYMEWAKYVHQELLRQMDLRRMHIDELTPEKVREQLSSIVNEIIIGITAQLPVEIIHAQLSKIVLDEAIGLGAIEVLLADPDVTEVMVNAYNDIYVEKAGKLTKSDVAFTSDAAVMSTIERIISPLGRRIDESSPMVDARLADGSRVNAIIPPLALRGPCITIRKFSDKKLTDRDLIKFVTLNESMVTFIRMCVEQKKNIIVSGGTGSGKTTLLNILSNYIPETERVITVEDAAELKLVQPHVVSLEARPPNMEGRGQVTIRDLVKNCLRMRPDRIVVGECRGGEALDMLQAMNTGHDGSLTTAHANTPRDMLRRMEVMVLMAGMDLPVSAIREQIASAVHIVIQQSRFGDGTRKITNISEITGMESGTVQLNEIFKFQQDGFDEDGRVKGEFVATGTVPHFYDELQDRGIPVDMSIFKS